MEDANTGAPEEQGSSSAVSATEAQAAAKSNRWMLWLLLAAIVIGAAGVVGWRTYSARNAEVARIERVKKAATQADTELEAVWATLRSGDSEWNAMNVGDETSVLEAALGRRVEHLKDVEDSVAKVRTLMEDVDSAPVSKAYLEVCDDLTAVVRVARNVHDDSASQVAFFEKTVAARSAYIDGWNLVNDAVADANARKHGAAIKKAEKAKKLFVQSVTLYEAASNMEGADDVSAGIAFAKGCAKLADMQRELSRIGQQGGVNSYNRQIKRLEDHKEKLSVLQENAEQGPGGLAWGQVVDSNSDLVVKADSADEAWEKAKLLVASGKF